MSVGPEPDGLARDDLAGVVDLFAWLTREELSRAFSELAFKRRTTLDEDAINEAIDVAVAEYALVPAPPGAVSGVGDEGDADGPRGDGGRARTGGRKDGAEPLGPPGEPRSARGLTDLLDARIAPGSRGIEERTAAGLLRLEDSVLSEDHRRVDVYRRGVEEVTVVFSDDGYEVEVEERTKVKNKIDDAWRTLTDS